MQYNNRLEDKEFYNDLGAFHSHMDYLEDDLWISDRSIILETVPKSILVNVSYTIDNYKIGEGIYLVVLKAFEQLAVLERAEIYSKDFKTSLENIKKKVDLVSRLAQEPIVIPLPKSKGYIKAIFYAGCKQKHLTLDNGDSIPHQAISDLFQDVFEEKLYKGNLEVIQQEIQNDYETFHETLEYYQYALKTNPPKSLNDSGVYVSNPYTEEEEKELTIRKEQNIRKELDEFDELEREKEQQECDAIARHIAKMLLE